MKAQLIPPKALKLAVLALEDAVPGLNGTSLAAALSAYEPGTPETAPVPGQLLTLSEAGERLRVSERTVLRLVKSGRLPAARIGTGERRRKLRIAESTLLGFEAESTK